MRKDELEVIKEGKSGHGILIENDGFISLNETSHNRNIKEGLESGGWHVPHPFIVDAVFQKFGIKNANGRIYPEAILKREVDKYQSMIDQRMATGELNHPSESTIDLSRVSHNIVELHWEGSTLVGKMELNTSEGFRKYGIVTTRGDEAANLLLNGYKIGVSSRGVGSVEQKLGQYIVGEDFELICWDVVSSPSTPGSYISMEGPEELQQYIENKVGHNNKPQINEKVEKIKKILSE